MSIYQLKSTFQQLLRPLVRQLARLGVTANAVTMAALLVSVALGVVLGMATLLHSEASWVWLSLPIWLFIRMALNAIDGMLAREHGQQSHLGAILNEVGDVLADAALLLPFMILAWQLDEALAVPLILASLILSILTEYIAVLGPMLGASRRYDGPLGKSDRAFVLGVLGLAHGLAWLPSGTSVLSWVFAAFTLLLLLTCIKRARAILSEVKHA
ncbi:CDP-alcohol phosphatidyltransferase family protein [Chitinibacter sp. FCG-7]|uniref:CDP-alcohol phosphatidyltransferase family protein n=1 Tax=Chitinibacter mangrovi TaxID=3153927 RepID=A0AAU7FC99_9NEIS